MIGRVSSPVVSLTSSASLPVSCAEGGGLHEEVEGQKFVQQCSPPPGFTKELSDTCATNGSLKKGKVESEKNSKETEEGNINNKHQQNDAQQEENMESNGNLNQQQEQQNNNSNNNQREEQMPNGRELLPSSRENNDNNNILLPGIPPEIAAAINGGHDLFVHIHPGDSIALAVGNEIQQIHGPATIRMVSQSMPPTAIPMNVPHGHVVQQLLDSQVIKNIFF